jgi:hypothetical protein
MTPSPGAGAAAQSQPDTGVVHECPFHFAIEVSVMDGTDQPVSGVAVELRKSEKEAVRSRTDDQGLVRFEGLLQQSYNFSLYAIAADSWSVTRSKAIAAPNSTHGPAKWEPISTSTSRDVDYEVKEGECVTKIAARAGVPPETIWNQNAELQKERSSMNVLAPGDRLKIPELKAKMVTGEAGQRFVVKLIQVQAQLKVRFLNPDGSPRSGLDYLVEFTADPPVDTLQGTTNEDGYVIEQILPQASDARITLAAFDGPEEYPVRISALQPVAKPRGWLARLRNLGYGASDDEEDGVSALLAFQRDYGLTPTGEADDPTKAQLEALHQS